MSRKLRSVERMRRHFEAAGLNLSAMLPIAEYDACVPPVWCSARVAADARGVLLVGAGGRELWPRFRASPETGLSADPLDRYTVRVLTEAGGLGDSPARHALYSDTRDGRYLPMIRLAARAGLGSPGRLGLLIHPRFGPWISLRGLLFVHEEPPAFREPAPFDPCTGCPAPCESACHGHVVSAAGVDFGACLRTRLALAPCRSACDARGACVVGPEHAYTSEQLAHHAVLRLHPPSG